MSKRSKADRKAPSKPKPVDFNLTSHGVLIRISSNPDRIDFFDQKLASYEKQLRSMDADYAYEVALGKIQIVLNEVSLGARPPISCKAGCGACCHQKVDLGTLEGDKIRQHLAENRIEVDTGRLEKQASAMKNGSFQKLSYEERRCIFLGDDQNCRIYSARPLMCRRHFVQNDPAICRTEDVSKLVMDVNPDTDAYLSAYVTKNPTSSLPEFVQENCSALITCKGS
ncbi:YkgJ family cysteine cluster protein [Oligoflexus tunisiensis]|uniref:YkgJ family cysteine cluster protein n=1 Tax=Oligoflexus tunisiensis TaxID=708132 RepID=UPI00114C951F|nr:YkgJ family cysteine cluster protein [Oligoflexus tunisiensis]